MGYACLMVEKYISRICSHDVGTYVLKWKNGHFEAFNTCSGFIVEKCDIIKD